MTTMTIGRSWRRACGIGLVLTAVAMTNAGAAAQTRATTTAISSERVVLHVTASTGVTADLTILNGEMARITFLDGPTLGLTPVLQAGGIRLVVFEIRQASPKEGETIRQIKTLDLKTGSPVRFEETRFPFDVEFTRAYAPTGAALSDSAPNGPCTECCVTCDGIRACACSVKMDCGTCCCPTHCGCLEASVAGGQVAACAQPRTLQRQKQ